MSDADPTSSDNIPTSEKPKIGLAKQLVFATILIILTLLPFVIGEFALRQWNYGGYPPVLKNIGTLDGVTYYTSFQPGINSFFKNSISTGGMEKQVLVIPKDPNVVRVFALGGSAMRGYPQPRGMASTAFFEEMLSDLWPERKVEVLNLGTTALASFPLMYYTDELLELEPDLVILFSGNNEFYGANGVASIHTFGQSTAAMRRARSVGGLAVVDWASKMLGKVGEADKLDPDQANKTLMERVIADGQVAPDDPRRTQAAENLGNHVRYIVEQCQAANVPVIVCTTPANERDLAPLGEDLDAAMTKEVAKALDESDLQARLQSLEAIVAKQADHAMLQYRLGQTQLALNNESAALSHFTQARDLDPMPWRSLSSASESVRNVAEDTGAVLCDLEAEFRKASPYGAIGWELMDDHVHPSLDGQLLIARSWLGAMRELPEPLKLNEAQLASLPGDEAYKQRLGVNPFDEWAVAHRMRRLLKADFFARNNTPALEKFDRHCQTLEAQMTPDEKTVLTHWVSNLKQGYTRPISGIVGAVYMKQGNFAEAQRMLSIAARNVERYSIWNLQLSWRAIICGKQLNNGRTTPVETKLAREMYRNGITMARIQKAIQPELHHYLGLALHTLKLYKMAEPHLRAGMPHTEATHSIAAYQALADTLLQQRKINELQSLLEEEPKSPALNQARTKIMQQLMRAQENSQKP